jgi:hypothetical protein
MIYRWLNRPKYKFYMFMTIGRFNEEHTILVLSSLCNVLYVTLILVGFLLQPRNRMLIITALTLYVGPVIILLGLGALIILVGCFAFYPVYSVIIIWIWFLLTSQVAQLIGRYLGLDTDADGNVDLLDFLYYCATTNWGRSIGLLHLHATIVKYATKFDPLQEIKERLDQIAKELNDKNTMKQQQQQQLKSH